MKTLRKFKRVKLNQIILTKILVNYAPTLLSSLFWLFIAITGFAILKSEFENNEFYVIISMIWVIVLFNLTRIISIPIQTYEVEEGYYKELSNKEVSGFKKEDKE